MAATELSTLLPDRFRVVLPIVAGIGNALLSVPLVRQLAAHPKNPRISVVARIDAMAEPFRRLSEVSDVYVSGTGIPGVVRAVWQMRRLKPDLCLLPFPSNRWQYNVLIRASGAPRKLAHAYSIGRWGTLAFLSGATRVPAERGLHDVTQNLRLLTTLGMTPDYDYRPTFVLNDADHAAADTLLGASRGFIALHAGSAQTILANAKRWPSENYAALIDQLDGQEIICLEGPDEAGVANEIARHTATPPRVVRLRGNLGVAGAVLARAKLYVGSDSGLAHLAAAVGTRAVTLFAPADPQRVCPTGNRAFVVQAPCPCRPCLRYPWEATRPRIQCAPPLCITRLSVDDVLVAVRKALA